MPVLTGIGHERDSTVLDEVAHQRFDTPSKVVAGIQALIVKRARESQSRLRRGRRARCAPAAYIAEGRRRARRGYPATCARRRDRCSRRRAGAARHRAAQRAANVARRGARRVEGDVRQSATGASGRISAARIGTASLATEIRVEAAAGAQAQRERTEELRRRRQAAGASTRLRWGAEAAEATFREVVAQGPREDARPRLRGRSQRDRRDRHQRRCRQRRQEPSGAVPGRIDRRHRAP